MAGSRSGWIDPLTTPLAVTLAVCAVWSVWAIGEIRREPVGELANVGQMFVDKGKGSSTTIDRGPIRVTQPIGYDGQFFYFIALDPRGSPAHMDEPTYRYGRVLYPLVVRAVTLGQPAAVPWALLFVNLAAVAGGTFALAVLLRHWPLDRTLLEQLYGVIVPTLVSLALAASFTRRLGPSLLALALNVVFLVVLLLTPSYDAIIGSARITLGVTCAFLACLPLVPAAQRAQVALVVAVLAMSPWYAVFPDAFGR